MDSAQQHQAQHTFTDASSYFHCCFRGLSGMLPTDQGLMLGPRLALFCPDTDCVRAPCICRNGRPRPSQTEHTVSVPESQFQFIITLCYVPQCNLPLFQACTAACRLHQCMAYETNRAPKTHLSANKRKQTMLSTTQCCVTLAHYGSLQPR